MIELNAKFEPSYRHEMMNLLMRSYSDVRFCLVFFFFFWFLGFDGFSLILMRFLNFVKVGVFPHLYQTDSGEPCCSNVCILINVCISHLKCFNLMFYFGDCDTAQSNSWRDKLRT